MEKLIAHIGKFAASGKVVPIGTAYSAFAMDVVTEYAMEKGYGNLDQEDFNQDLVNCLQGLGTVWHLGKHVTWIPALFAMTPAWIIRKLAPKAAQWKAYQEVNYMMKHVYLSGAHLLYIALNSDRDDLLIAEYLATTG